MRQNFINRIANWVVLYLQLQIWILEQKICFFLFQCDEIDYFLQALLGLGHFEKKK